MASNFNFLEEFGKEGGALPEQRVIKRNIIQSRRDAKAKLMVYRGHKKQAEELKNAIHSYYIDIIGHVNEDIVPEELLIKFFQIRNILYSDKYNVSKLNKATWSKIFQIIDEVGREIGILKITRNKSKTWICYEIFDGIGWHPTRRWKNWQRTRTNIKNLARQIKRKDKDARGLVAGQRGTGKTTFSLYCMQDIAEITGNGEITRDNFVMSLKDMKRVRDKAISPYQMDEILTLLNAKRAMSNENVETEEILSKMRWRNTFGLWCTTQLENLTKSHLEEFDFLVEMIEEGKFKFYNKTQLEKFEKKSGEWQRPGYNWIGHFPEMKGGLWKKYQEEIEPRKDETRKEIRKKADKKKEEKEKLECNKCGYTWKPRTENPSVCPKCKSSRWDKE